MVCPYCHKEIPEDSIYCYHCGKELSNKQALFNQIEKEST